MLDIQLLPTGNPISPTMFVIWDNTNDAVLRRCKKRTIAQKVYYSLINATKSRALAKL